MAKHWVSWRGDTDVQNGMQTSREGTQMARGGDGDVQNRVQTAGEGGSTARTRSYIRPQGLTTEIRGTVWTLSPSSWMSHLVDIMASHLST